MGLPLQALFLRVLASMFCCGVVCCDATGVCRCTCAFTCHAAFIRKEPSASLCVFLAAAPSRTGTCVCLHICNISGHVCEQRSLHIYTCILYCIWALAHRHLRVLARRRALNTLVSLACGVQVGVVGLHWAIGEEAVEKPGCLEALEGRGKGEACNFVLPLVLRFQMLQRVWLMRTNAKVRLWCFHVWRRPGNSEKGIPDGPCEWRVTAGCIVVCECCVFFFFRSGWYLRSLEVHGFEHRHLRVSGARLIPKRWWGCCCID